MASYGVTYDVTQQEKYDKTQIAIRLLIFIVLAVLANALGWVFGLAYLIVPIVAAVLISQKGAATYFSESERGMQRWLAYLAAFYSYFYMLTDKMAIDDPRTAIRFEVAPSGEPTAGNVLLRIILAIPHAIVLGLLGIVAFVLAIVAAIMILANETYSSGIFDFLRGYMRWHARLYVYLAGFAQEYPPFSLDTGSESSATPPPQQEAPTSA